MSQWTTLASDQVLAETKTNLEAHGFTTIVVDTKTEALEQLKSLIPAGSEVMSGSSTTLNEIGYTDLVASPASPWVNVHAQIVAENDDQKRNLKRRHSVTSEYFLSSVNAVSKTGALIAVDATGSRVTALPHAAQNVVLVVSTQKITDSIEAAMERVRAHVFPLENERSKIAYGVPSKMAKWVILEHETSPKRTTVILVKEVLGF